MTKRFQIKLPQALAGGAVALAALASAHGAFAQSSSASSSTAFGGNASSASNSGAQSASAANVDHSGNSTVTIGGVTGGSVGPVTTGTQNVSIKNPSLVVPAIIDVAGRLAVVGLEAVLPSGHINDLECRNGHVRAMQEHKSFGITGKRTEEASAAGYGNDKDAAIFGDANAPKTGANKLAVSCTVEAPPVPFAPPAQPAPVTIYVPVPQPAPAPVMVQPAPTMVAPAPKAYVAPRPRRTVHVAPKPKPAPVAPTSCETKTVRVCKAPTHG